MPDERELGFVSYQLPDTFFEDLSEPELLRLEDRDGVPVAVPGEPVKALTADAVRAALENLRR